MQRHHRRSIRLKNHDYTAPGAYYITLVTKYRENLFGEIRAGKMILNEFGLIINEEWLNTPIIRPETSLGTYQIMPNHFHAILIIQSQTVGAHGCAPQPDQAPQPDRAPQPPPPLKREPRSLGSCIAGFKSITTARINRLRLTPKNPVWQRNYYEHIIRNNQDWQRIEAYIQQNPLNWETDHENFSKVK